MLYSTAKKQFQRILYTGGVGIQTIKDMEIVAEVSCANQFLLCGGGKMGQHVRAHDTVQIQLECKRLLTVDCAIAPSPALDAEAKQLATLAALMPELATRENVAILESVNSTSAHLSEQFPPGLSSTEQKTEYSINIMIKEFSKARRGVLKPSARPANRLLNAALQFALSKAGHKDNLFALTAEMPNFAKFALKGGASEENIGGAESNLALKKEGGELEPRSIGIVGKLWTDYLRYVQAMWQVTMPDGSIYGQEEGFVILEECYAEYASQRPSVACVCSALSRGWAALCDELITSSEGFVQVCKNQKRAGVWIEALGVASSKRKEGGGGETAEVKRLKAQLASAQRNRNNGYRNGGNNYNNGGNNNGGWNNNNNNNNNSLKNNNNNNNGNSNQLGQPCFNWFAGRACAKTPCPFRHHGPPPSYNPAKKSGDK